MLVVGQDFKGSAFAEGIMPAIYFVAILTEFVAILAILGFLKIGLDFIKGIKIESQSSS